MQRRGALKFLAAGGLLAATGVPSLAYARRKPTMTVITDIDPATPLPYLAAMLGGMLSKGLPVSCIVHTHGPDGSVLRQDSALAVLLRGFMNKAPGLLELIAHVPDLAGQTPHFQARLAYRARADLIEALIPDGDLRDIGPILLSLACEHSDAPLSPEGARSAGIRNILVLPKSSGPVSTESWSNGVLRLFGGVRGDLFAAVESLGLPAPEQFQNIVLLSARENTGKSEELITAAARVYANVALRHEADQWTTNVRICDLQLRDGYFDFSRQIGLHLFEPGPGETSLKAGFKAFQAELTARKFPFSTGTAPDGVGRNGRQGYWVTTEDPPPRKPERGSPRPETLVSFECNQSPQVLQADQAFVDAGLGLILDARAGGAQGIDECGRLNVPAFGVSGKDSARRRILEGTGGLRDMVIAVSPDILSSRAIRSGLLNELDRLTGDWVTKLVPVSDLVRPIAPKDHVISLYRQTEAYKPRITPVEKKLSPAQREALLENALAAWSYFYRFTNKQTGLCPATVKFVLGENEVHNAATMWDVGSLINAQIAAVDLEIISDREFTRTVNKILTSIAGRTTQGRTLPSGWIKTDRVRYGDRNFDGSDAGRLLAALWNLSQHRLGNDRPAELIKSWDLEKIIINGRIHSVIEGELVSSYESHSAHYAALAFRNWGFDVDSPYEVYGARSDMDDRIRLMEAVVEIGPLGAEPLMLEALDFGLSRESAYLADVLYGAQMREFDKTGRLVCVSEGPIDQSPWFTYQGLQFDAPDRTWAIDTVGGDPRYRTAAFHAQAEAMSPKAAFLWAAYNPHPFSDRLLDFVRANGATTIGFASNIYLKTGKPTQNYSDINTNGVILQAVAHMLRDKSVL